MLSENWTFLPENCQGPLFLRVKTAGAPLFSSFHIMKCKYGQRAAQQFYCHHKSSSVKVKKNMQVIFCSCVLLSLSESILTPSFLNLYLQYCNWLHDVCAPSTLLRDAVTENGWLDGCVFFSSFFLHQKILPPILFFDRFLPVKLSFCCHCCLFRRSGFLRNSSWFTPD